MALTFNRVLETADEAVVLCNQTCALLAKIDRYLEYNSDQAIDWAAGSLPAYISEDSNGNIEGRKFSRQAVANVIGSLASIRALLTNGDVSGSQGDHLGNLNQLSQPMPIR